MADTDTTSQGLRIRSLAVADRAALSALADRVSRESSIARFHGAVTRLSESLLDRLLDLEEGQREAVVAEDAAGIVGVARFARDNPAGPTAEVAVLVADDWQRHGVAHRMVVALVDRARRAGITTFRADMFATNTAARLLLADIGEVVSSGVAGSHVVLTVDIRSGPSLSRPPA